MFAAGPIAAVERPTSGVVADPEGVRAGVEGAEGVAGADAACWDGLVAPVGVPGVAGVLAPPTPKSAATDTADPPVHEAVPGAPTTDHVSPATRKSSAL